VATAAPPLHLDVDAHGRVTPRDDATRRALADRAGHFQLLPSATDLLLARRTPVLGAAAAPPRCVLAGDLSGFPIVDFVAFVHQSRVTGVLTVASDGAERAITFKDGEVRGAASSATGERLGDVAVRLGFVTREQAAMAEAPGQPPGRALVSAGVVTPNDLWKCVHEQVAAVFHAILLARTGVFYLVDEDATDRAASALTVNTQSLLMDGIRRIDEMSLFKARIPGPGAVLRRREPRRSVPLNAGEQQLIALVDGRRTVAALASAAHLNEFDATKTLYHLAEAGYVEATTGEAPGEAPLETIAEVLCDLVGLVTAAVPGEHRAGFRDAVRRFLGDPAGVHAPLWEGVAPAEDGAIDRKAFLERLAALPPPVLQRLQPAGDRRALAREALRDLLFFHLFALGGLLPREEDDRLAAEVRRRLAGLEGTPE
jgi:hypothetical protein